MSIVLGSTSESLTVYLAENPGTAPMCVGTFVDEDTTTGIITPGSIGLALTTGGASTTTIVAAPASGHVRGVSEFTITNLATTNITITVFKVVSGPANKNCCAPWVLTPGQTLQYNNGDWKVLPAGSGVYSPAVVGSCRNLYMSVSAASATATMYADEVIVETALGGTPYKVSFPSGLGINLGTTGAGGMDTGTPTVGGSGFGGSGGYVGNYVIYNPTTGALALMAADSYTTVLPQVYGGSHMPSGYTASALVGVWPVNSSRQFMAGGVQKDRAITVPVTSLVSAGTASTITSFSLAPACPPNATSWNGYIDIYSAVAGSVGATIYPVSTPNGSEYIYCISISEIIVPISNMLINTTQTGYYRLIYGTNVSITCSSYTF